MVIIIYSGGYSVKHFFAMQHAPAVVAISGNWRTLPHCRLHGRDPGQAKRRV